MNYLYKRTIGLNFGLKDGLSYWTPNPPCARLCTDDWLRDAYIHSRTKLSLFKFVPEGQRFSIAEKTANVFGETQLLLQKFRKQISVPIK